MSTDIPADGEPFAAPSVVSEELAGATAAALTPLAPGLYLVATPIGNLEDMTLRGLRVLRSVDRIACEDTRQTVKLLNHFGIKKPTVSYHLHNEQDRSSELVAQLIAGARIAVVSDAGTPGIADPGEPLVRAAIAAGIPVFPVPGANAVLSALIASGFSTESFTFHGFLPSKEGQRRTALEQLRELLRAGSGTNGEAVVPTQIFYEAPHRIRETLAEIVSVFGPGHKVALARELTKLHEEFLRGTVGEVLAAVQSRAVIRGEMVLLLDGRYSGANGQTASSGQTVAEEVAACMRTEAMSEKDALKRVAKARGLGKSEAYREWQRSRSSSRS
ncbi:MAG: 16S rRNA (cytidine(1402)-2'-O)-methyltransferase [Janthinobacterium lividum]